MPCGTSSQDWGLKSCLAVLKSQYLFKVTAYSVCVRPCSRAEGSQTPVLLCSLYHRYAGMLVHTGMYHRHACKYRYVPPVPDMYHRYHTDIIPVCATGTRCTGMLVHTACSSAPVLPVPPVCLYHRYVCVCVCVCVFSAILRACLPCNAEV